MFLSGQSTSLESVAEYACAPCRDTGWVRAETGAVTRCECLKRRIADERVREVLRDWPAYAEADLDTIEPRDLGQRTALNALRADPGGSYFLHGSFSSGKTHLLVAQYRHAALTGAPCALRSSKQLVDELRKAEMDPEYASPVLRGVNLGERFHLFWDDMDKAPARTEFRQEAVWDLLDTIARRNLRLSVTSNLSFDKLAPSGTATHPIVSRLDRICTPVAV